MSIIFLVGARCAGKTSLGQKLAQKLNFDFVDTDQHLRKKHGLEVSEIVANEGWPVFRKYESECLREAALGHSKIIATGGGMVLAPSNRAFMKKTGLVIYLSAPAEVLSARLAADPQSAQRPSLTGKSTLDEVRQVLEERETLYVQAAHYVIKADDELGLVLESCLDLINRQRRQQEDR